MLNYLPEPSGALMRLCQLNRVRIKNLVPTAPTLSEDEQLLKWAAVLQFDSVPLQEPCHCQAIQMQSGIAF